MSRRDSSLQRGGGGDRAVGQKQGQLWEEGKEERGLGKTWQLSERRSLMSNDITLQYSGGKQARLQSTNEEEKM